MGLWVGDCPETSGRPCTGLQSVEQCCLALVTYRSFKYGGFKGPASLHFFRSSLLCKFVALRSPTQIRVQHSYGTAEVSFTS